MANSTITQKLDQAALKKVVDAFALKGIKLVIDQGPDSILDYATNDTWGTLARPKRSPPRRAWTSPASTPVAM